MKSNRDFFKNILAKNDLVSAPLASISFLPYRRIIRKYFDGLIYSEMMSVEGIKRNNDESVEYLDRIEADSPIVFQLFGGKPESFSEAVKIASDHTKVEAFDINMGCPVKKVLKAGGGCSLIGDLDRMKNIIKAVRSATDLPFSVKTRIGLDRDNLKYKEILKIAEGEGVDALIMHARTKADMFGGIVRLDILEEMSKISSIPIIGNGGVTSYQTYLDMKKTGVAGIMVGRAMMKSPWVFEAIRNERSPDNYLSADKLGALLLDLWGYMLEHAGERANKRIHYMHIIRKFAVWFSKGMDRAVEFRTKIYQTNDEPEILDIISNYYR